MLKMLQKTSNVPGICGNVIYGDVSDICGNLDECNITETDRKNKINISDLIS